LTVNWGGKKKSPGSWRRWHTVHATYSRPRVQGLLAKWSLASGSGKGNVQRVTLKRFPDRSSILK